MDIKNWMRFWVDDTKGTHIWRKCKLYGYCCLGVAKNGSSDYSTLGNGAEVSIGAKILGGIYIVDDIVIGTNAVVTCSFCALGIIIAGIPARKIKDASLERKV